MDERRKSIVMISSPNTAYYGNAGLVGFIKSEMTKNLPKRNECEDLIKDPYFIIPTPTVTAKLAIQLYRRCLRNRANRKQDEVGKLLSEVDRNQFVSAIEQLYKG